MSTGGLIGGVVGGIIGFLIPPVGIVMGAMIGFGIGMAVDPIQPDIPSAGQPELGEFDITTADEGLAIADVLGTTKLSGNILWYCCDRSVEVTEDMETGKGGSSEEVTTGYKYYLTWAIGLCLGPVDVLYTVYKEDECVWAGELNRPVSGGEETITLTGMGSMTFYFGTTDQAANATLGGKLDDSTLNPPYRGLCWAFFDDCHIGDYYRAPTMKFVVGKRPTHAFSERETIGIYDYNPAHAVRHILETQAGLPASFFHDESFSSVASALYGEDRGVSVLFDRQNSALTYIESALTHAGAVLRYGNDGKFHLALLRKDTEEYDMIELGEDDLLEPPVIKRKSWLDTLNEIEISYARRDFLDCDEEPVCDAPVLSLVTCSDYKLLERDVISWDGETKELVVSRIEGLANSPAGGTIHFNGISSAITDYSSGETHDTLTLASGPAGLANGESLIIETTDDTEFICEKEAVFYATGDCLPFTLERSVLDEWIPVKEVKNNFCWKCMPEACAETYVRVRDTLDQTSCESLNDCVELAKYCDCSGISMSADESSLYCEECTLVTTVRDPCCPIEMTGATPAGNSINQDNADEFTVCAPSKTAGGACCPGEPFELELKCCGEVVSTFGLGFTYDDDEPGWDTGNPETIAREGNVQIYITGGAAPFHWTLSTVEESHGFWLDAYYSKTSGDTSEGRGRIYADAEACGSVRVIVTDACGNIATGSLRCTTGYWVSGGAGCIISEGGECSNGADYCKVKGEYRQSENHNDFGGTFYCLDFEGFYAGCEYSGTEGGPTWGEVCRSNCEGQCAGVQGCQCVECISGESYPCLFRGAPGLCECHTVNVSYEVWTCGA